jgi:hypothetical protein
MARIASTTSAGVPISDPTGGMTIDALMARQKMLAEQAGQIGAPRQMISPWQGAAQLAQTFVNNRKEHATEDQLKAGRAALAQIMSGIDPASGATSAQTGQAYQIDPDLGLKLMDQAIQARREAAAQQLHQSERTQDRQWTVEDTAAAAQRAEEARKEQEAFQTGQTDKQQAFQQSQQDRSQGFARDQANAARANYGPVITGDAAKALGLDATKSYQKNSTTGQYDPIGTGTGVTINTGDTSSALTKQFDTKEGESWNALLDAGSKASATLNDMQLLDALGQAAPQGPIPGTLAKMFPGISSAGAAYQSVVKRLAPQMRAVGSGSTSDIEYNGMLESLPNLSNLPEANQLISGMMKAKAGLDVKRADIVTAWRNGELKDAQARTALAGLNRQSIMTPELEAMIVATKPQAGAAPGAPPAAPGGGWTVEELP